MQLFSCEAKDYSGSSFFFFLCLKYYLLKIQQHTDSDRKHKQRAVKAFFAPVCVAVYFCTCKVEECSSSLETSQKMCCNKDFFCVHSQSLKGYSGR